MKNTANIICTHIVGAESLVEELHVTDVLCQSTQLFIAARTLLSVCKTLGYITNNSDALEIDSLQRGYSHLCIIPLISLVKLYRLFGNDILVLNLAY